MKTLIYTALLSFLLPFSLKSQSSDPENIVQSSLEAYNQQDINSFMTYFSDSAAMKDFGEEEIRVKGKKQVRKIFEDFFNASPNLHSKILNRMVFDNKVIDHEYITGARGNTAAFEVIVIYEIIDGKIDSMTAIRK